MLVQTYFIENFYLLTIVAGMAFILVDMFREKRRNAVYGILILLLALLLSISNIIQRTACQNNQLYLAIAAYYFGIVMRPLALYFFIRLSDAKSKIPNWAFLIPISILGIVYLSAFFPGNAFLGSLTYTFVEDGGVLKVATQGPLYLLSHVFSLLYLAYLLYVSVRKLGGKDYLEGISLLVCSIVVVLAVVLGTLGITANLLNTTIAISCVFYYLFLTQQQNKKDPLTDLYNRQSYYRDVARYGKTINAALHIDMNGLKTINDTLGHEAGDNALSAVALSIKEASRRNDFVYRIGGDEFIVLMAKTNEILVREFIERLQELLKQRGVSCSIGYAIDRNASVGDLVNKAEEMMYERKRAYYIENHIDRRKRLADDE